MWSSRRLAPPWMRIPAFSWNPSVPSGKISSTEVGRSHCTPSLMAF